MKSFFDNEVIELPCPLCSHVIKQKISWFKSKGKKCPGCQATLETSGFAKGISECEKAIEKFSKALGKL